MKGIIELAPKNINEYQGKKSLNFKIQGNATWFKVYKPEEELKSLLEIMNKGSEIDFEPDQYNETSKIEVTKVAPKQEDSGSNWNDDKSNFEDLLDAAHEGGLQSIDTELVHHDFEKKTAVVHATVTMIDPNSEDKTPRTFEAYGDASKESLKDMILPHFIRMAETRAISRALRWATNNAKTAVEETGESDKEESGPKDVTKDHADDTMNM